MHDNLVGTISQGTLKDEDLRDPLLAVLRDLVVVVGNTDDLSIDEIIDLINENLPTFLYCGAHEGDGADIGIWIDHDRIIDAEVDQELIRVESGTDWTVNKETDQIAIWGNNYDLKTACPDYVLEVSDHGNATLKDATTKDTIWSVI